MREKKRWLVLWMAGLLVILCTALLYADELADCTLDDGTFYDNTVDEITASADAPAEELLESSPSLEGPEELLDSHEIEEVGASSTTTITGFYNSSNGGDIRWSKVNGATGYVLYRMRSADGLKKVATINDPDTIRYIDGGIKDDCWGRVYTYYVRPIINGKEGAKSNQVTLQRLAPMKFTKNVSNADGQATLSWECSVNSNKALGYEIQYAASAEDLYGREGSFKKVSVNGRNNLNKTLTGLERGAAYYFRIRCYVNYTHSITEVTTRTWSQYSKVVSVKIQGIAAKPTPTPTPTVTVKPEQTNIIPSDVKVGDTVSFGSYEQDGNANNGKEKIEWLVLDKDGAGALLISKYGLDRKPYNNTEEMDVTWETCTLRSWLNNDFLNTAYTTAEKAKIRTTNLVNENNPDYGTAGGNNTDDKVFLLSISEVKKYFASDSARLCKPTAYTVTQGVSVYNDQCWWWLRTPGTYSITAANVDDFGGINLNENVRSAACVIRPAIWVDFS